MLRWEGVAVVAIGFAACKHPTRLEGHWRGVKAEGVALDVQSAANSFATSMELEVRGDQIKVTTMKESQTGTFKIIKDENATMVITTDKDGPDDKETFTFLSEKQMKWAVLDGKVILFEREAQR